MYHFAMPSKDPGFNLKKALRRWDEDLAGQPGLTPEARHELEVHLRDTMTGLREAGLTEEESFIIARRRVGAPQQVAEEFSKENPSSVWRMRALWVVGALMAFRLIQSALAGIAGLLALWQLREAIPWPQPMGWLFDGVKHWLSDPVVDNVISVLTVLFLAILMDKQPSEKSNRLWRFFFGSRWRFLLMGGLIIVAVCTWERWGEKTLWLEQLAEIKWESGFYDLPAAPDGSFTMVFPFCLALLMICLIPSRQKVIRPSWFPWLRKA
jgi:hypothetical protein